MRWDNLFDVPALICRAQNFGPAYALEGEPRRIVFRLAPPTPRTSGQSRPTVNDAVPAPDLDIRPGYIYYPDRRLPNSERPFLSGSPQTCFSPMPGREAHGAPNTSVAPLGTQDLVDVRSRRTQAARVS